ncbi:MAG: hypothetical protein ACP5IA_04705 [Sediminispirochaetaceae bacterium]
MRVFSNFFQYSGLRRGAFLLVDQHNGLLIPRLHTGLDVSSSRRLRLPIDRIEALLTTRSSRLFSFESDSFFEPYLSRRIFESTGAIRFIPFFHGVKLVGCLVEFADIDHPSDFQLPDFPSDLREVIGAFIVKSRERIGRIEAESQCESEDIMQHSEILVSQAQKENKRVLFFILDLSTVLNQLSIEMKHIDLFYLKKDLQYTVSLLGTEGGFCGPASDNMIILAIKARHSQSQNVMIHQIKQLIRRQCYENLSLEGLTVLTRIWPDDNMQVGSLLSDFFSNVNERS